MAFLFFKNTLRFKIALINSDWKSNLLGFLLSIMIILLPSINYPNLTESTTISKTLFLWNSLIVILAIILFTSPFHHLRSTYLSKIDFLAFALFLFITINRYVIQSSFGFSNRYYDLVGLLILYVLLRSCSVKHYLLLVIAIIISGIIQSIQGLFQHFGHISSLNQHFKITGSYFNPGPYGGFLALVFVTSLGVYFNRDDYSRKFSAIFKTGKELTKNLIVWISTAGMATTFILLPNTESRSAWLAAVVGFLILFIDINIKLIRRSIQKVSIRTKIIGFAGLFLFSILLMTQLYQYKKESADGRILIWKVSMELIKSHPFVGIGFDRFKTFYMNEQADYFTRNHSHKESFLADNNYYAFNELIQFTAENGIIGLAIILILLVTILRTKIAEELKFLKHISISVLLAGIAFGQFSYASQILSIEMFMVVFLALIASLDKNNIAHYRLIKGSASISGLSRVLAVFFLIPIWFGFVEIQNIRNGFRVWKIALKTYDSGFYKKSIRVFNSALPQMERHGGFLTNYGKALAMTGENEKAIEVLTKAKEFQNTSVLETTLGNAFEGLGEYEQAEQSYIHANYMVPNRFYPHYRLAKMHLEMGHIDKAKKKAQEVLNKKIKIPSKAIDEIKLEMKEILEGLH